MANLRIWLLNNAFTKDGNRISSHWARRFPNKLDELMTKTVFLPSTVSVSERVFAFLNGQTELNKCMVCGKYLLPSAKSQQLYCSPECTGESKLTRAKVVATSMARYGVENPQKSAEVRTRVRETCNKRYGGNTPAASRSVVEKMKATTFDRYGVTNVSQLPGACQGRVDLSR